MPIFADGKLSKFRSVFTSRGTRDCFGNNLKTFNARHASMTGGGYRTSADSLASVLEVLAAKAAIIGPRK